MISALETMTCEITGFSAPIGAREMLDWQFGRIRRAMERAASSNKKIAERFAMTDISSLRDMASYSRVPFTYPEELSKAPEDFVCSPSRDISRVTSVPTSGSTGEPKRLCFTVKDLERTVRLFELGMRPIIGNDGKRCVVMMSDATPGSLANLLKSGVEKSGFPCVIYGNIKDVDDASRAVQTGDVIVGIPAQTVCLCRKYPTFRPASVLLSADYIPPSVPDAIRRVWKCRVYTHYGMTETCFGFAVQCDETSAQHIRHDSLLVEIIDPKSGRQLNFGESGEIVVTDFANEAMPLFRYRTGDISSLVGGVCSCGSRLPRLGRVLGRLKNRVFTREGSFSLESLYDVLYSDKNLWTCSVAISGGEEKNLGIEVTGGAGLSLMRIGENIAKIVPKSVNVNLTLAQEPTRSLHKTRFVAE